MRGYRASNSVDETKSLPEGFHRSIRLPEIKMKNRPKRLKEARHDTARGRVNDGGRCVVEMSFLRGEKIEAVKSQFYNMTFVSVVLFYFRITARVLFYWHARLNQKTGLLGGSREEVSQFSSLRVYL